MDFKEAIVNDLTQIILAIATLITSIGTMIGVILAGRNSNRRIDASNQKIDAVHEATNSKMDKLLRLTEDASFRAGEKAEKDRIKP